MFAEQMISIKYNIFMQISLFLRPSNRLDIFLHSYYPSHQSYVKGWEYLHPSSCAHGFSLRFQSTSHNLDVYRFLHYIDSNSMTCARDMTYLLRVGAARSLLHLEGHDNQL